MFSQNLCQESIHNTKDVFMERKNSKYLFKIQTLRSLLSHTKPENITQNTQKLDV